jgi:hypothetical protein
MIAPACCIKPGQQLVQAQRKAQVPETAPTAKKIATSFRPCFGKVEINGITRF